MQDVPAAAPAGATSGPSQPRPNPAKFATPREAVAFAEQRAGQAERAASAGRVGDAYEAALAGWEALQPHASDGACQALSDRLLAMLEAYGEQLPSSVPGDAVNARLKIR